MSTSLVVTGVALAATLVALGVVAVKVPKARGLASKLAGAVAAALAAITALALFQKEKVRAHEVAASTKEIKTGRKDAKKDAEETEREIGEEVAAEEALHEEASEEQESLKKAKRERLKA